jgi:uncharacterized SAM-binding protein YcdF (DUF218 family)
MKTAIVVLSHFYGLHGFSDRQLRRMNKGIEEFNKLKDDFIITTGGFGFFNHSDKSLGLRSKEYLLTKNIEEKQILFEGTSRDTVENFEKILPILLDNKITKIVVVTSVDHMLRAKLLAKRIIPKNIELRFVISDYHSTLKVTIWDFFWHLGGWIKLLVNPHRF